MDVVYAADMVTSGQLNQTLETTAKLADLYGLGTILSIGITIALFVFVGYVFWVQNIHQKELAAIINNTLLMLTRMAETHQQQALDAARQMTDAASFQRQEHKEMVAVLNEIAALQRAAHGRK